MFMIVDHYEYLYFSAYTSNKDIRTTKKCRLYERDYSYDSS